MSRPTNVLALDIGAKRIGVARANSIARLPEPLPALANGPDFQANLRQIIEDYDIDQLVIGLPRNLSGVETAQSKEVRQFCTEYIEPLGVPLRFVDETLTSVMARDHLRHDRRDGQIDSEAACIVLETYISGKEYEV